MSDETTREATTASQGTRATDSPAPDQKVADTATPDGDAGSAPTAPRRRRRRRGSRGGRNRRRRASSGTATSEVPGTRSEPEADRSSRGAFHSSPAGSESDAAVAEVDRGLTAEDVAATAKEEAGLESAKPRIGDTRPAPPPREGPKIGASRPSPEEAARTSAGAAKTGSRRRRRGGRSQGGGDGSSAVVQADLGLGEVAAAEDLDEETRRRRRGRTRKGRAAGRYLMCVHVHPSGATHIAVLEGRNLVEHSVGGVADDDTSIDGNIYLGRVQNVLPGMEAAFVDIATPKNGVLYRGDVAFDPDDVDGERRPRIERLLRNGQSVLVQVTKNPIGAKGARLTQEVSLPGRFVVMVPGQPETYGISKRLPDDERRRLRRMLEAIRPPDAGLIVRTAAEGATAEELERDVTRLQSQWEQISKLGDSATPPRLLYKEPPLVVRVIREEFTKEYRGVVMDDRALHEEVRSYVEAIAPDLADRVEYYDEREEGLPLYERYHVHEQLIKALDRKVWLPSGGSIIVERTEALTVIDVNTGKNVGKSNLEETVFRNNLEAAEEIARQLRLRDIGGIIVIDFIDMEIRQNRDEVMRVFKEALARDKTRTQVFEISELGLVEMTRKRISEGLLETFSTTCPTCSGRGIILDESQLEGMQ
jgi:ribonuclease E